MQQLDKYKKIMPWVIWHWLQPGLHNFAPAYVPSPFQDLKDPHEVPQYENTVIP